MSLLSSALLVRLLLFFIYTRKSTESEERQVMSKEFAAKEKLEIVTSLSEAQTAKEPGRKIFAEMLERISQKCRLELYAEFKTA